ncbi:uncharacterized protein LOC122927225 [Bufo gargarizans]|uniref:uncharacterized protein LOC122927225 n=1 Tax=Bufo gargarizans TaxID=30331 RepID=UPI001CF341A7|nr:uncharacterized protein LOC122927225 [Bufo gargarizans]
MPSDIENVNYLAEEILVLKQKRYNKYRLCSLHFAPNNFIVNAVGRALCDSAKPTIFENIPEFERKVPKTKTTKAKVSEPQLDNRALSSESSVTLESSGQTSSVSYHEIQHVTDNVETPTTKFMDACTQTDFDLTNSILIGIDRNVVLTEEQSPVRPFTNIVIESTPLPECSNTVNQPKNIIPFGNILSPICGKNDHNLVQQEQVGNRDDDNVSGIFPLTAEMDESDKEYTTSDVDGGEVLDCRDTSYDPLMVSHCSSDLLALQSFDETDNESPFHEQHVEDMVNEPKLIINESCLDILLRQVKCQYPEGCNLTVNSFSKQRQGSALIVRGSCRKGHQSLLWNTQPKIGRFWSGNVLLAASILCSGLNFQKVDELFNIFGLTTFSETTFYRYQTRFIFPAIDIAWQQQKTKFQEEMHTFPMCLAGDGQCDSPGHSAKYCIYTVMELYSEKIIDFEVVHRSQCNSSVAMEKFGFKTVMERVISNGFDVCVFVSDRHVSIQKVMRELYPDIDHQFDIWHYAKSIKKKLIKASNGRAGQELKPWIDKIVNHFWWTVKTCDHNELFFRERCNSVLHHIVNKHEWEDGEHYKKCSHAELEIQNSSVLWLKKESNAFHKLEEIVRNKQFNSDVPHLIRNCHTGPLEAFHSLVLKYRTKRIHFGIDGMEARTKLAILAHNNNIGRDQAVVHVPTSVSAPIGTKRTKLILPKGRKRWTVKNVYEPMSVQHVENILVDCLKIALGDITPEWNSRTPDLPPNIANVERPKKADIVRQHWSRFGKK